MNSKMMKKIFLASVFIFTLISCNQWKSGHKKVVSIEGWELFSSSNFQIHYPKDWKLNQDGEFGTTFVLFRPKIDQLPEFLENVNLMIQDLSGYKLDLNGLVDVSLGQIAQISPAAEVSESLRIKEDDVEYHKITYSGVQNDIHLKWLQYYFVKDNKAYVLTYTALHDTFDDYIDTAVAIMNTFVTH
jgi:hypothetical protein